MTNLAGLPPLGQKTPRLVSRKIRASARGMPCTLRLECCNHNPETTVFAHLRFFAKAGMAQKPMDLQGIYACSECHRELDEGEAWGWDDVLRAYMETIALMWERGILEVVK